MVSPTSSRPAACSGPKIVRTSRASSPRPRWHALVGRPDDARECRWLVGKRGGGNRKRDAAADGVHLEFGSGREVDRVARTFEDVRPSASAPERLGVDGDLDSTAQDHHKRFIGRREAKGRACLDVGQLEADEVGLLAGAHDGTHASNVAH